MCLLRDQFINVKSNEMMGSFILWRVLKVSLHRIACHIIITFGPFYLVEQDVCLNLLRASKMHIWKLADKCSEFTNSFKALSGGRIFSKACIQLVPGCVFPLVFIRQEWDIIRFGFSVLLCTIQRYKLKNVLLFLEEILKFPKLWPRTMLPLYWTSGWKALLRLVMRGFKF